MTCSSGITENLGEIVEEEEELSSLSFSTTSTHGIPSSTSVITDNESSEDALYVAVGNDFKGSKFILEWTLSNFRSVKKIFLIHVHLPAQTIPMMGGRFPISQLSLEEVKAYHLLEKEKKDKNLNKYLPICIGAKVQAEKLIIEKDDVAKGLIESIAQFGIKRLVMGAAAYRKYSKKMKMPLSKKACMLCKEAPSSCQIWFVCKRHLICTRDEYVNKSPTLSPSVRCVQSEPSRSKLSRHWLSSIHEFFKNKSLSSFDTLLSEESIRSLSLDLPSQRLNPQERQNEDNYFTQEGIPTNCRDSNHSSWIGRDEAAICSNSSTTPKVGQEEDGSSISYSVENFVEDTQNLSLDLQKTSEVVDLYEKMKQVLNEIIKLKEEANEESCKHHMAERRELAAIKREEDLELNYTEETKLRKEAEEALKREKLEVENLRRCQNEIFDELQMARNQNLALESKLTESNQAVRNLTEKLASLHNNLNSLKEERDGLLSVRDAEKQCRAGGEVSRSSCKLPSFSEFSYLELHEATRGFERSLCIGEGGYGSVYKGFLRHTTVAIKKLHSKSMQGPAEFTQEIDILSSVRHPNLVTLIGACSEQCGLVYEFLPNGSLEDRLSCVGNTLPLSWQVRIHICAEICSALIFLHSNRPQSVVHGDLKPANILLDASFTSKLSDFGLSRLLAQSSTSTTPYHLTDPKGTFVYMDPEFALSGELTPQSDVYSFGIVVLRLLTGKPPLGLVKVVKDALENETLQKVLDSTAGAWPFPQVEWLAKLGVRCSEISRKNRPDLSREAWGILETVKSVSMDHH